MSLGYEVHGLVRRVALEVRRVLSPGGAELCGGKLQRRLLNHEDQHQWHALYVGRAWNEMYILRAFLQYNQRFKIIFFNTYLQTLYRQKFVETMPLCLEYPGGSIWVGKEI